MSEPTVYLISGANRGIGLTLVTELAKRPNTIVFAGAREPSTATELSKLAAAHPNKVHIVPLVSADKENNLAAVQTIRETVGKLDVVIANAGVGTPLEFALEVAPETMLRHFDVNVNGPLVLFQATYPLLKESKIRKFVAVSTPAASIHTGSQWPGGTYAYSSTKAALNWVMRKLHRDFEDLVVFPLSPGMVGTDMALAHIEQEPYLRTVPMIDAEENAKGMLAQIDQATRETHGGQFVDYRGVGNWEW
ncbi:hypothetical protein EV714DRAFT_281835 [Schizophyllum commune]